ncbi:WYL domain-containing protein [Ramlibacter sp. H39-3-26]|uniref:helix-turn-helix transcriptional regulator n=1 Tax=Curvibacter soli TaxID=3031331 RepID=UPI0023DB693A|nr:WYL domain-containing protein [Ramlibacter sp. H39-3-26]MDF1484325.1 WYL domain-containing protein [Ramlibacter sp. H39-3-26]
MSRATFKRDMEYLRERLQSPITWDRDAGGYRFEAVAPQAAHTLPGLWFSCGELHALLVAHQVLGEIAPGVLAVHVAPLQERLAGLLGDASGGSAAEVRQRVRLLSTTRRATQPRFFAEVAAGLLERRRSELDAWNRRRDEVNTRTVSPQRLTHYRDNWYLDAWCHWRRGLRSFSLDTLRRVRLLPASAIDMRESALDAHYASAYGIFGGRQRAWAVLRFAAERARWVASERWHPEQKSEFMPDGDYRLRVPYGDERELRMDILRHGRHVRVEGPPALRRRVAGEAAALADLYARDG